MHSVKFIILLMICITSSASEKELHRNLRKLADATNHFAFALQREISFANATANAFISLLSLATAFSILHYAANGTTKEELSSILGYTLSNISSENVPSTFRHLFTQNLAAPTIKEYSFESPCTVIVNETIKITQDFQSQVEHFYQTPVTVTDFAKNGNEVVSSINKWVRSKTNDKIMKFLESLNPELELIVLSAAYFRGSWKAPFPPKDTRNATFYNHGWIPTKVPTMHLTVPLPYYAEANVSIIELPFRGCNVSAYVMLPAAKCGIRNLETMLSPEFFERLVSSMRITMVAISLPRFRFDFSGDLLQPLRNLGLRKLFEKADLSKMTSEKLAVGEVTHKATIDVAEGGIEAAAVTAIISFRSITLPEDMLPKFKVDRPFLLVLVDKRTSMLLFVGNIKSL